MKKIWATEVPTVKLRSSDTKILATAVPSAFLVKLRFFDTKILANEVVVRRIPKFGIRIPTNLS
jgi:hypothetical protein